MLNALIGTRIKIVSGYPGQAQILLAMERGEIQGMGGWGYSNLQMHIDLLNEKKINLLMQGSLERIPQLPDVPTPFEFVKRDEDRKVFALFYLQQAVGHPVLAPPGVPSDRLKALRAAFMNMGRDQRFRADAAKAHIKIDLTSNESIEKVVQVISTASPATIERFAELNAPPSMH
jgi:tripartite-type tricarboxylate transporter receptor subunit TctC